MDAIQTIVDLIMAYRGWVIFIAIGLFAFFAIKSYGGGILKFFEQWGQNDASKIFKRVDVNDTTRAYLEQASKKYSHFKLRGLPSGRAKGIEPPQLDQAYVSVRVLTEQQKEEIENGERGKVERLEMLREKPDSVHISEATKTAKRLAVMGIAGSGKSTLLQWIGLACAKALLKQKLSDEQKELIASFGGKPLVPFLIPLRAYATYCHNKQCDRTSKTLLNFMTEYFSDRHASLEFDVDFFKTHLQKGCLLMVDGLDEVDPEDRASIRTAIEELLTEFDKPDSDLRCFLASRPSAIQIADQMQGFQKCEVQRLTDEQRDNLIEMWYKAVLADDLTEANRKSNDLSSRIEASDRPVQDLATTPLMVTIFAMVHYSRDELPKQRAKLYEDAVEVLLTEVQYKGEEAKDLKNIAGMDPNIRRYHIARIAFELRERGEDYLLEDDLVELIWKHFGTEMLEAKRTAKTFLRHVAERGGLLESIDDRYGFYTHATFQEYLAGRYLAEEYPQEHKQTFLAEHITNDLWEEAIRLAAGYLAISGRERANSFVLQIVNAGLGRDEDVKSRALYVAGLALADIPKDNRLPNTVDELVPQMTDLLKANPPRVKVRDRFNLGMALGTLGDPRLKPLDPECILIPAGEFRMGTNAEDKKIIEEQKSKSYPDEEPSHQVYVSEFSIGKYPVTNLEFAEFFKAKGYEKEEYWSKDGWLWRTSKFDSDLSWIEDEKLRQNYKDWLAGRPVELRDKPYFWEDPQWNTPNLPVVGVTWFEAEAYCNWLSKTTNKKFSLPSEAQWEKAARWKLPHPSPLPKGEGEARLWAWGNTWGGDLCNNDDEDTVDRLNRTSPVGMYPNGASDYGAMDMMGNVWEWCADWYDEKIYEKRANEIVKDPQGALNGSVRVLRGGSWVSSRNLSRCAFRLRDLPNYFNDIVGFRFVLSPDST